MEPKQHARWGLPALATLLYFSQGFPFGVVTETVNLYLSYAGVPLSMVGLVGSVGLAWTAKVLWAPLVDLLGTYRLWILGSLAIMAVALAALGVVPPAGTLFWIALTALAIASATQDIAIDALTIRITPSALLGLVNSARVTAYRVAIIAAGGGLALIAGTAGWGVAFGIAGAVPLVLGLAIALTVPRDRGEYARPENPLRALWIWFRRPGSLLLLAVILLYRLGDSALTPMIKPFWASRGFGAAEVGTVTTTLGMICTIAGAVAGGFLIARIGIFNALWSLGLVQMLSNLTYAAVALTGAGRPALYGAAVVETFCGGLGIAAFLSFLMVICDRANAATEYAMLSAVFGLSRTLAGAVSGFFAQDLGFATYFLVTAVVALPGLALLPLVRTRIAAAESG